MLPLFDTTLIYHQPDHLTPPEEAERIARVSSPAKRFKLTAWLGGTARALFHRTFAPHKA